MVVQIALGEEARAHEQVNDADVREVRPDVAYLRALLVNVAFIGRADAPDRRWLLVDTGVIGTKRTILSGIAS